MKMLKNIYVLIIIACSVASFWMISTKQMEQSDFLLRNVEALANNEGITSDHTCVYDGQYCILYLDGEVIFQSFRYKPEN